MSRAYQLLSQEWKKDSKVQKVSPKDFCKLRCGPGRVKQEFAKEVDIRQIVARYRKANINPYTVSPPPAVFADLSMTPDFSEKWNMIAKAKESFESLPFPVRKRFNHDPKELLDFVADKDNYHEAVKLGLVVKKEVPPPAAPPASPAVPPPAAK